MNDGKVKLRITTITMTIGSGKNYHHADYIAEKTKFILLILKKY